MKFAIPLAFVLLLAVGWQAEPVTSHPIMIAAKAAKFAFDVYKKIKELQKKFAAPPTIDEQMTKVDAKMFEQLDNISGDIRNLRDDLFKKISSDLQDKLSVKTDKLIDHIKDIERMFKRFQKYANNKSRYHRSTLEDFAKEVLTSSLTEMSASVEKMYEAFADSDLKHKSILSIIAYDNEPEVMCIRNQSPHQMITELYKTIIMTDAKALAIKLFAYEMRRNESAEYQGEIEDEINEYSKRVQKLYDAVLVALTSAPRQVWKCDPSVHKKDKTYSKLQEVFQAFFNYEGDSRENRCDGDCSTFNSNQRNDQRCISTFCNSNKKKHVCKGHFADCKSMHNDMTYCYATDSSEKRYDWMKTGSDSVYGVLGSCPKHSLRNIQMEQWMFVRCEFCLCTCVSEEVESDRYFSLHDVVSDVWDNKVVTGVKLVKENHVFQVQIQQGRLGSNGTVESATWKSNEDEPINFRNIAQHHYEPPSWYSYDYQDYTEFKSNPDVFTVKWDQKTVFLDVIEPLSSSYDKNLVVTSLRFSQDSDSLRLEVQTTEFDYESGKLTGHSKWHRNPASKAERTALSLSKPDAPTNFKNHMVDSQSNQYVEFQITDLKKNLVSTLFPSSTSKRLPQIHQFPYLVLVSSTRAEMVLVVSSDLCSSNTILQSI